MMARIASLSDLDDLSRLVCSFRDVLGRSNPADDSVRESLRSLLISGEGDFLLAIDDSANAVGYSQQRYRYSLWLEGLEATLEDLYVTPDCRGRGVATCLVRYGIERAWEKGCKAIKLDTNEDNLAAVALYGKLGFSSRSSRFSGSRQLLFSKTLEVSS